MDRRDVAVHRIDAFERDQLRRLRVVGCEQFFQMRKVVMAPHALFAARVADARDHRRVIELVRIDDAVRQELAERAECRLVRDIARGEKQRAVLAVQVGEFMLKVDVIMGVAADVARAARTGADVVQRLFHRLDDLRMLAHREIVVRAPDGDRLRPVMASKAACVRKSAFVAQNIDEDAVASLFVQPVDRACENIVIVHVSAPHVRCPFGVGAAPSGDGIPRRITFERLGKPVRTIRKRQVKLSRSTRCHRARAPRAAAAGDRRCA